MLIEGVLWQGPLTHANRVITAFAVVVQNLGNLARLLPHLRAPHARQTMVRHPCERLRLARLLPRQQ